MSTLEITYCDNCGEVVHQTGGRSFQAPFAGKQRAYEVYESLPWPVESANEGESGVVCSLCVESKERKAEDA